jgi:hypothetical protein
MSRRSAYQLQISRTMTASTTQEAFTGILPGVPTESFGIPIIITDSISDTNNDPIVFINPWHSIKIR